MAKVYNYLMLTIGLILLFNIAGLTTLEGTILGQLDMVTIVTGGANLQNSSFWVLITAAFVSIAGLVAVSTVFARTDPSRTVTAGLASSVLIIFVFNILGIANVAAASAGSDGNWIKAIIYFIAIPFVFGFVFAIYEWIIGQD